jgi:ABC-2 type transport system ATP-binding protein
MTTWPAAPRGSFHPTVSRCRATIHLVPATPAIAVRDLQKSYGSLMAVDGVSLEIEPGEVFALLGPNGAGKTTLVEILEGYRPRTAGEATVLGVDPSHPTAEWRARIGIVLQLPGMFEQLTVEELISHFAGFYPAPMSVERAMTLVGIAAKRHERCSKLSGGQRRRVDLALGLIGDPELIFLDEPTTGFDPSARRQAWEAVRELTSLGKTVLLTTHYMDEAEALADRVGVIIAGKLAAVSTPRDLGGRARAIAHVRFANVPALSGKRPPDIRGAEVRVEDGQYVITTDFPTAVVKTLGEWAFSHGVSELPGLTVTRPSLEDTYLQMLSERGATPGSDGGRL